MGLRAHVLVIGPFGILREWGVQDYPERCYISVPDDALVLGTVTVANTTLQSKLLAKICGVGVWDLGNHRVLSPRRPEIYERDEQIGPDTALQVYNVLQGLLSLKDERIQLWYRPNG